MNHAEYIFSDEHQSNEEELRKRCGGLEGVTWYLKRHANVTDLDRLLHDLPRLIAMAEEALALTQKMKQKLKDAREASK